MQEKTPLYVLNKFLKFEKKIYRFNDIRLPQPIQLKVVLYFLVSFAVFAFVVALPGLGTLIRLMPPFFVLITMVVVPFLTSHLLAGVGTENRPPINAFTAFLNFHILKAKRETYYKGKIIKRPHTVRYQNTSTVRIAPTRGNRTHESIDKLSGETHREEPGVQPRRNRLGLVRH